MFHEGDDDEVPDSVDATMRNTMVRNNSYMEQQEEKISR
jgi:hypothetical protein